MFSRHLSVSPANKTNKAHIDIIFNSRIKSGQSPYPKNLSYGKTWYTGSNMPEISEISANINSTGPLDRLSSTMTLRIYDQDGSELWTARHELEIASPLIRRADQAALHNLKTIFSEFEKEFIIKPETVPAAQQISNNSLQKLPDENQSSADTIESLSLHNGNVMPAMLIIQSNEPDKPNAVNEEPQTESPDSAEQ
ncbi:MAG: hypothetical protein ISR96_08260 [Nitrospira sp.]|nr:hypothetical protein [Nitrospira sp.]